MQQTSIDELRFLTMLVTALRLASWKIDRNTIKSQRKTKTIKIILKVFNYVIMCIWLRMITMLPGIIVTHLYFRICGIENLVNEFRKGKENLIKRNL